MKNEKIKSNLGLSSENDSSSHMANCVCEGVGVTPQKCPKIFIIKIIIYFGYNWANLGIFLGIFR